ncbi:MAG: YdcF family protein, partial [Gemmatimonadaceae bacterium]
RSLRASIVILNLLLKGRGADTSARPLWLLRLCGAAIAFASYVLADLLGAREISGFSPFPLLTVSMLVGVFLAPSRFGSALWLMLGMLVSTVCLVSFTPIVRTPAQHFVRADNSAQPVDAVIVLSGGINGEGLLGLAMMNRLTSGIAEARRRGVGTIALSIVNEVSQNVPVTSEADQRALLSELAPDLAVLFVRDVHSTHDEALQFAALGRTHGWQRVALVTSPLHTRRSCRTFERAGLPVSCVPARAREYSLVRLGGMFARLNVFRDILYETTATLVYSTRGWD